MCMHGAARIGVWLAGCLLFPWWLMTSQSCLAQDDAPSLPGGSSSLSDSSSATSLRTRPAGGIPQLPSEAGQYWQEYDLRPYTKELNQVDRPHQAVIDWVLRETGSEAWFTDPFGFINADRDTLRVYHNEQMHQVVRKVYERFVNGTTAPQLYGMRLITIGSPNWRTRAHSLLRSQPARAPGVNAYLVSKENNALLLALLRGRSDYRELSSADIVVHNGQSQVFEQLRGRNFVENQQPVSSNFPPYMPVTGEIKEGYQLHLSPLLSVDRQMLDLRIKCNIDQVEKLNNVALELPTATGQMFSAQIQVPQVVSWRLDERFSWPSEQVMILSCGVVAAPQGTPDNTLLGQGTSLFGLDRVIPGMVGSRAEALLMIEYKGDAAGRVATIPAAGAPVAPSSPLSRGRY